MPGVTMPGMDTVLIIAVLFSLLALALAIIMVLSASDDSKTWKRIDAQDAARNPPIATQSTEPVDALVIRHLRGDHGKEDR